MLRRKLVVSFVLLFAVGMFSLGIAPASAEFQCPNNFNLAPSFIDPQVDRNGNGALCFLVLPTEGRGGNSNVPGIVVIDDK